MGTGGRRVKEGVKTRIIAPAEGLPGLPPPSDSDSYTSDSLSDSSDSSGFSSGSDVSSPRRGGHVRRRSPPPAVDKRATLKQRERSPHERERTERKRRRSEDEDYHRRQRTRSPRRRSPSPRRPSLPPRKQEMSHKRPASHSGSPSPSGKRPLTHRQEVGKFEEEEVRFVERDVRVLGREKDDTNRGGVDGASDGKGGSGSRVVNGKVAISVGPRKGGEMKQSGADMELGKKDEKEKDKGSVLAGVDEKAGDEGGIETGGLTQGAEDVGAFPLDDGVPVVGLEGEAEKGEMGDGGEATRGRGVDGGASEGAGGNVSGFGEQREESEEKELFEKDGPEELGAQKGRKSSRWDRKASPDIEEEGEVGLGVEAEIAHGDGEVKESEDARHGDSSHDRTEGASLERRGDDQRSVEMGVDERRGEAERFEKRREEDKYERRGDDWREDRRRDERYDDERRRDERHDRAPDRFERPRGGRFEDPRKRRDDRYDNESSRDRRFEDRGDRFEGERAREGRFDDRRRTERDHGRPDDRRYEGRGYGDRGHQDRGYDGRGPERPRPPFREDRTERRDGRNFEERGWERGREHAAKAAPYERPETMQADREERARNSGRGGWGAQRGGSFKQPTEKWGHDKFDEINQQGNEVGEIVKEDPYAKIEALLAM
ncbi:hypothetical protein KFL_004140110 [Klebsormidium nitens]|uniref:Uncharacterized protein n=1 Tax=Klebsormidium nitens TaxID=105231 RepID=A0A0U9HKH2_KLENI|nr:hypothetical protein KFL_004140110 [Klebsormidium nitens]|eukprot:GAQ88275.1 hypothetical protein KFL_004140110 [Klebsormidium nitens]